MLANMASLDETVGAGLRCLEQLLVFIADGELLATDVEVAAIRAVIRTLESVAAVQ